MSIEARGRSLREGDLPPAQPPRRRAASAASSLSSVSEDDPTADAAVAVAFAGRSTPTNQSTARVFGIASATPPTAGHNVSVPSAADMEQDHVGRAFATPVKQVAGAPRPKSTPSGGNRRASPRTPQQQQPPHSSRARGGGAGLPPSHGPIRTPPPPGLFNPHVGASNASIEVCAHTGALATPPPPGTCWARVTLAGTGISQHDLMVALRPYGALDARLEGSGGPAAVSLAAGSPAAVRVGLTHRGQPPPQQSAVLTSAIVRFPSTGAAKSAARAVSDGLVFRGQPGATVSVLSRNASNQDVLMRTPPSSGGGNANTSRSADTTMNSTADLLVATPASPLGSRASQLHQHHLAMMHSVNASTASVTPADSRSPQPQQRTPPSRHGADAGPTRLPSARAQPFQRASLGGGLSPYSAAALPHQAPSPYQSQPPTRDASHSDLSAAHQPHGGWVTGLTPDVVLDRAVSAVDVGAQLEATFGARAVATLSGAPNRRRGKGGRGLHSTPAPFASIESSADACAALLASALAMAPDAVARVCDAVTSIEPWGALHTSLAPALAAALTSLCQTTPEHAVGLAAGESLGRLFVHGFFGPTDDPFLYVLQLLQAFATMGGPCAPSVAADSPTLVASLAALVSCVPAATPSHCAPSALGAATQLARVHISARVRRAAAGLAEEIGRVVLFREALLGERAAATTAHPAEQPSMHSAAGTTASSQSARCKRNSRESAEARQRTVHVAHVPPEISRGAFAGWLESFGPFDRVRVVGPKEHGMAAIVFVEFTSAVGAAAALNALRGPTTSAFGAPRPAQSPISTDDLASDALYASPDASGAPPTAGLVKRQSGRMCVLPCAFGTRDADAPIAGAPLCV